MITVIIATLNEEENVANVIKFAKQYSLVTEVLVVDDKSIDNTVRIAQDSGARVITSTRIGKGGSMREGVMFATNEVVVFLDADINPYPHFTIKLLTEPILSTSVSLNKAIILVIPPSTISSYTIYALSRPA